MVSDRKPNVWEVELQSPDGATRTEKVHSFWSPLFDGVKHDIATAARCAATIRNKGKVQFEVISEPKRIGKLGDEGVAA